MSQNTNKQKSLAAISYFFLGGLFLLSRSPEFRSKHVRKHSQRAFLIQTLFVGIFIAIILLRDVLDLQIGALKLDKILFALNGIFLIGSIIQGVSRATKGEDISGLEMEDISTGVQKGITFKSITDERSVVLTFLSYIPFLGLYIDVRFSDKNISYLYGAKLSTSICLFYTAIILLSGSAYTTSSLVSIFIFTILLVIKGYFLFFEKKKLEISHINKIPTLTAMHIYMRSAMSYCMQVLSTLAGKKSTLNKSKTYKTESNYISSIISQLQKDNKKTVLSPYFSYIPVINIIGIVLAIKNRKNKYGYDLMQGIVLSILLVITIFFQIYFGSIIIILLFVFCLSGAKKDSRILPGIHEIVYFLYKKD